MKNIPTVVDLFAGVGGLSLGAARAGFRVAAAIENDAHAINFHSQNFQTTIHSNKDVSQLTGRQIYDIAKLSYGTLDGLIGGPPCQGFSVIGSRQPADERNNLFGHFFRLVAETKPKFFVAENVPGIMNKRYDTIRDRSFDCIRDSYEILKPIVVKANLYGAATSRTRMFFIGYNPTKFGKSISHLDFLPDSFTKPLVVRDALEGLPHFIDPSWQTEESGWRNISLIKSEYLANLYMDHVPVGVGNLSALIQLNKYNRVSGFLGTVHTPEVAKRYGSLLPGQVDLISKSVKLDAGGYCPTIRAGTAKDKGSFQAVRPIHFSEARVIAPREAARLQGFPDWFIFHPTKWHSFRQIGNSVSPIVGESILHTLFENL